MSEAQLTASRTRLTASRLLFALLLLVPFLLALFAGMAAGEPTGATITSNSTDTGPTVAAGSSTTAGGSFTFLLLNATTQTPRWKAYVGNVSGSLTLQDGNNFSIYSWGNQIAVSGEVYASRAGSINWNGVQCVQASSIITEESTLNMTPGSSDSINSTFNLTVHKQFYIGTSPIANSSCRAIATYVGGTAQTVDENADFQEVLLEDGSQNLIYAALIDDNTAGYNNAQFDFQMIVPEDEYAQTPHTYYFWLELS